MKSIFRITFIAFVFVLLSFSAYQSPQKGIIKRTPIAWKEKLVDVGKIPKGIPKLVEFEFVNLGKTSIVITKVHTSCGCTTADYTKEPVTPGKKEVIKAVFDAARTGAFSKTVMVTTNISPTAHVLTLTGIVAEQAPGHQ